jgi:hypothetical protein
MCTEIRLHYLTDSRPDNPDMIRKSVALTQLASAIQVVCGIASPTVSTAFPELFHQLQQHLGSKVHQWWPQTDATPEHRRFLIHLCDMCSKSIYPHLSAYAAALLWSPILVAFSDLKLQVHIYSHY